MDNAAMAILSTLEQAPPATGLKVVRVLTSEPYDITLAFEGSQLALDLDIFEVPINLYPLIEGDQLLGLPIIGQGYSQRWGLIAKLTSGVVLGTMQSANSLKLDGSEMVYDSARLIIPLTALQAGDKVSVLPTLAGGVVKYVVAAKY